MALPNFIDSSYFVGERNIPNKAYAEVSTTLENFIKVKQREFLEGFLGYELYLALETGWDVVEPATPAQKWVDIVDGVQFTGTDGRLHRWRGLRNTTDKLSPIADFVYYHWLRKESTHSAGTGEVLPKNENSKPVSSAHKQAKAWNDMVEKNMELYFLLQKGYDVYPEYLLHTGYARGRKFLTKINRFDI